VLKKIEGIPISYKKESILLMIMNIPAKSEIDAYNYSQWPEKDRQHMLEVLAPTALNIDRA